MERYNTLSSGNFLNFLYFEKGRKPPAFKAIQKLSKSVSLLAAF